MRKAWKKGKNIHARFNYAEEVAKIFSKYQCKELWKYDTDLKIWRIPLKKKYIRLLKDLHFKLSDKLQDKLQGNSKGKNKDAVKGLKLPLRPYQAEALQFVNDCKGRAIIGDDMGLGKTASALAYLQLKKKFRPALVVCPASVKYGWEDEFQKFGVSGKTTLLHGRTPDLDMLRATTNETPNTVFIINYDILTYWTDALIELGIQVLIIDECHMVSNPKALRTKALSRLVKTVDKVIGLSGTPITSSPKQFFPILNMIRPDMFPSWWQYAHRYCGAKMIFGRWDFNGSSHSKELHSRVSQFMIRRMKSEVMKELPEKTRSIVPIEMSSWKDYNKIKDKDLPAIEKFTALRKASTEGKLKSAIQWIKDYLEDGGEKLVVFAHHRQTILDIEKAFKGKCVKIMGGCSAKDRKKAVTDFQTKDKIQLFLGNLKATGTGLNGLQDVSSNAVVLELPWTPGDLLQAEDRLCRSGQKNATNIYYLMAHGTMDILIAKLLIKKMTVLNAVVDGTEKDDNNIIEELNKLIVKKRS